MHVGNMSLNAMRDLPGRQSPHQRPEDADEKDERGRHDYHQERRQAENGPKRNCQIDQCDRKQSPKEQRCHYAGPGGDPA